uniref:Proline rich 12b n=1 Tax=Sphaeramia orbicularis TaxID=375764 RepID=A0A672YVR9_9TELE
MERNYPAAGFGDLGAGTGWSYDRSAKASLMYGSSRSSHPDSELIHRQAYSAPHPLQGYATNHHPGSLSGLFDASLHHASPSGPDASVMNLISALDSRGPQPSPSASSLLSQFRAPSWQTAMHTPAPAELFISGALPGSSSFPSSSALSAYQHPGSFSGRPFTPSISLQDTPTFSPTSNGLLSPHDPLLHIKTPSQSTLGFDRLLSSQSATYRSSQEPPAPLQNQAPSTSSSCHLPPPQFNLLSSQLHNQSSQLYNSSMFSSTPALPPTAQPQGPQERAIPRQDSVIKHYQRSSPTQSTTLPLQQYVSCGGSTGYQQIASHHRHAGVSCSPLGEQSPSSDPKPSPRTESQTYRPIIQTPYTSSSSSSSSASASSGTKGTKSSSSTSGYSSSGSGSSSSRTPHTPPSASSTSSSSSSSSKGSTGSMTAPSRQQPPPQSVPGSLPPPVVTSALTQQSASKQCLVSSYGSPSVAKSSTSLSGQTPPQQQAQSYSPNQHPSTLMAHSYGGFNSPHGQEMTSLAAGSTRKAFPGLGPGERSFSAETVFGDSNFGSASLRRASSPALGYGNVGGSSGSGPATGAGALVSGVGSAGSGNTAAGLGNGGRTTYHLPESSPSPSISSAINRSGVHSPASARPAQSPGGSGANKYLSSILSPPFMSSPQGFPDTREAQSQSYHTTPPRPKTETSMLGVERSQDEEEDDDDFLIHHLLHHHQPSQQMPQPLTQVTDREVKGLAYNINKISEERYHLQSVIRTNNTTSSSGTGMTVDANTQMEISQKKQQPNKPELTLTKSTAGGVGEAADSLSHSHQQQHDSFSSVVHYGNDDTYTQHPHAHHPQHVSSHTQQCQHSQLSQHSCHTQHTQHSQHTHSHPHMNPKQPVQPHTPTPPQPASGPCSFSYTTPTTSTYSPSTEPQLSHAQLDPLKQHQFDSVSPVSKVGQNQSQQQRFAPLTSICFPDSLLHDEDRSFFPAMEDMFCSADYKSSCALKTGGAGESYDMVGHHSDQGYGQYCHSLPGTGNGNLHLDLDSLKTHELPSTVNTDQLGLIQSQTSNIGLSSAIQGNDSINKMMGAVGPGGSGTTGLTTPIFCSSRPKKLLKTSSFHLLKQRQEPQTQTKKNYAQEYEFEDDEDKADAPADIRLNSRRLPDLLPDLVSSCRKVGGVSGVSGVTQMMDMDFCHPSSYSSLPPPQPLSHDGPKKRGRKPTKPKREGPPRPRGRPRIRPLPEPPFCRGLMGSVSGESRRGRGRGRGRGRKEEGLQDPIRPIKVMGNIAMASRCNITTSYFNILISMFSMKSIPLARFRIITEEADEKAFDFKPGFMASFLDFLKTGKKQTGLEPESDRSEEDVLNSCSSLKGGIRPLSPPPPPPPLSPTPSQQHPPGTFKEVRDGEGDDEGEELALSGCSSPCKPLDEELKRNLETLPSFSSDEEDSVSKNQDLQKSISSAISALYDTPHSLGPPTLSPPTPQEPPLSPPLPQQIGVNWVFFVCFFLESPAGPVPAPSSPSPSPSPSPPTYSSPSPLPPLCPSVSSPLPPSPFSPSSSSASSSTSPPSPPTPEEAPPSQRLTSLHLAKKQADAAIAGESEEEDSESGGEGIFRERDEFVVRTEDIGTLKMALQTGREPPPIWRVQKALLQKFSPEIKDGQRQFCATSNYLGYFGDAKMRYQRLYVKFLENINKKDYVRVCSRKPWHRPSLTLRREKEREKRERELREKQERERREKELRDREHSEREKEKAQREKREREELERRGGAVECTRPKLKEERGGDKTPAEYQPRAKSSKDKAEPPPKKRKKWLKEVLSSSSDSDSSPPSDDEGPVRSGFNNRAMREMFRSYVEMLVSTALDPDMIQALEDTDDELYLPPMRKIDSLLSEQKKRLLRRVDMSIQHQEALHIFPKMTADPLESGAVKVHLGGEGYNRKTLNRVKRSIPKQQDLKLSIETCRIYTLYHSLHHYKYHTFLRCKKETDSIEQATEDPGQEEVVQQCMANQGWLENLFNSFMELLKSMDYFSRCRME